MSRSLNILRVCQVFGVRHPRTREEWEALHKRCVQNIVRCRKAGDEKAEKLLTQYKRVIFKAALGKCLDCEQAIGRRSTRCRRHDIMNRYHHNAI